MMTQEISYPMIELELEGTRREPRTASFKELVLDTVEESLSSFGESTKQKIYLHLKEDYNISIEQIPSRIRDFAEALEESYGIGGKLIEIKIMKSLYKKAGPFLYFPHGENLSFASYVEMLRYFI